MNKKDFLEKLNEKLKSIKILQDEQAGDIDELKEKLIPIIQKEFLDSIPKLIRRGKKIKVYSLGFMIERGVEGVYYIKTDDTSIRLGNWWNGLRVLEKELKSDLTELVGREVKSNIDDDRLSFYFYCEYNKILGYPNRNL